MPNPQNLTLQRFGRLVVLRKVDSSSSKGVHWFCICDCGNHTVSTTGRLNAGSPRSCGCLVRDAAKATMSDADNLEMLAVARRKAREAKQRNHSPEDQEALRDQQRTRHFDNPTISSSTRAHWASLGYSLP